jgi:hypothetical protein
VGRGVRQAGTARDAGRARGGRVPAAAPLFENPQTALVAHVPVGDEAVLVLTERRDERIFEPQDWDILRALALQARWRSAACG